MVSPNFKHLAFPSSSRLAIKGTDGFIHKLTFFVCVLAAAPQKITKEERIAALEAEMAALNARQMTTSSQAIGIKRQDNLEMFPIHTHNIVKNPDLMPCPRRPPGKK